ncbi:MAG: YcxB family protein [Pseudomonadota bacterium]
MKYKLVLNYTEALIRQAVFHFWWRTVGITFFVVLFILSILFGFLLFVKVSDWQVWALGAVLIFSISFITLIYFVHYKRSIGKFRAMTAPEVSINISEEELSFSSSLGTQSIRWGTVSEVWVFKNMWLFLYSKAQFSTIPLNGIPEEAKDYMLSKIKSSGGKIG